MRVAIGHCLRDRVPDSTDTKLTNCKAGMIYSIHSLLATRQNMVHGPPKPDLPLKAPAPVPKWAAVHEESREIARRATKTYRKKIRSGAEAYRLVDYFHG